MEGEGRRGELIAVLGVWRGKGARRNLLVPRVLKGESGCGEGV